MIILEDKFYSIKEAADLLEVSVRTLQRLRQDDLITPDKFGNNHAVFYSESQLQKFKSEKQITSKKKVVFRKIKSDNSYLIKNNEIINKTINDVKPASFMPVFKRKDPNDKISKNLFNMTDNQQEAGKLIILEVKLNAKAKMAILKLSRLLPLLI